ncbi:MAG: hypothetical protein LBM64_04220 [Deltaproteobacteria bacterium]|nr:hypothetical protein [Deltaproteobacteria bacterium]
MSKSVKPVKPVKPVDIELVFVYACPFCKRELTMIAPTMAAMVQCDVCGKHFPVVPVEERTVSFIRLILNNGAAAVDIDYM